MVYLLDKHLIHNQISRSPGDGKVLTLDEERTIYPPYAGCDPHHNQIFFPNGDTDGLHEHPLWGDNRIDKKQKTYMRSTSKKEAAARAK